MGTILNETQKLHAGSPKLVRQIQVAYRNITKFNQTQTPSKSNTEITDMDCKTSTIGAPHAKLWRLFVDGTTTQRHADYLNREMNYLGREHYDADMTTIHNGQYSLITSEQKEQRKESRD